ncbi:MAG TPA: radical SAM protein [Thermoanaerobaculia bacterium]|nr:radical SAM protein [Thermoanaerobaculia bacterium]
MRILLVRPDPGNERFGLGPFFRAEPLAMEYVAAALRRRGDEVSIVDLRFGGSLARAVRKARPELVGVAGMHALEYDRVVDVARRVKAISPGTFVLAGGHAAAAYPAPLRDAAIDAVCVDDGEEIVPALVTALERRAPRTEVPGLLLNRDGAWVESAPVTHRSGLDVVPLPARDLVDRWRSGYQCLLFKPAWTIETARGCPFRCSFCSVWQLYGRSFRERSIGAVVEDFAATGPHVFVVDDLFWNPPARSLELARALKKRGIRKRWILVQSRTDLVARNPELLEAWRPLARDFDIFFGLEAATDGALDRVAKDLSSNANVAGADVARSFGYGVTGNFLVDPDWDERDFHALWDFVARHGFQRAGYTILTPLPGTVLFDRLAPLLEGQPWFKYDMHHLLWEPRLGAERFFELYAETWRRSILNLGGDKSLLAWMRQVQPSHFAYIVRILLRTQRMMNAGAYLDEHWTANTATPIGRLPDPLGA